MKRRAFTLIEVLTVIFILGVLASLVTYGITQALRQARDAKRKNDLTAISLGFEARKAAKTCSDPVDLDVYPGRALALNKWAAVSQLTTDEGTDSCGPFSEFLSLVPTDRYPYIFNLSQQESGLNIPAKHYRLGAVLERSSLSPDEFQRQNNIWVNSFEGKSYSSIAVMGDVRATYNYFTGR